MPRPVAELAAAYLRQYRTGSQEDFWAVDEVQARILTGGDLSDAWALTLALVAAADDKSLGYVGAGPLEDFVRKYGASHLEALEAEARRDPKFAACLGCVWLAQGDLPEDAMARVVRASLGRIRPLPGSRHDA